MTVVQFTDGYTNLIIIHSYCKALPVARTALPYALDTKGDERRGGGGGGDTGSLYLLSICMSQCLSVY